MQYATAHTVQVRTVHRRGYGRGAPVPSTLGTASGPHPRCAVLDGVQPPLHRVPLVPQTLRTLKLLPPRKTPQYHRARVLPTQEAPSTGAELLRMMVRCHVRELEVRTSSFGQPPSRSSIVTTRSTTRPSAQRAKQLASRACRRTSGRSDSRRPSGDNGTGGNGSRKGSRRKGGCDGGGGQGDSSSRACRRWFSRCGRRTAAQAAIAGM